MDETSSGGWADFIQKTAGQLIDRTYDVRQMELQAQGQNGTYVEGRPGVVKPVTATAGFSVSPTILVLGAVAIAAVLLLRK